MASKQATPKETSEPTNRPQEKRLGRIKATIWANQTENGVRHNVKFCRLYKDADNKWADSDSFGRDDLLLLAKLADQVHTELYEQAASANGNVGPARGRNDEDVPY